MFIIIDSSIYFYKEYKAPYKILNIATFSEMERV